MRHALAIGLLLTGCAAATRSTPPETPASPRLVLDVIARFAPESINAIGLDGREDEIADLRPGHEERFVAEMEQAAQALERAAVAEPDPGRRQDLELAIAAARRYAKEQSIASARRLPFPSLGETIYNGVTTLFREVTEETRRLVVVRLEKYTGAAPGFEPLTVLAEREVRAALARPGLLAPTKTDVQQELAKTEAFRSELRRALELGAPEGWEVLHAQLDAQLDAWVAFVRAELLPRARDDFRLPPDLYALELEKMGIDGDPVEIARRARAAYARSLDEMRALAPEVATERALATTSYTDVLRALRREQVAEDDVAAAYQRSLDDLEALIRRERIVTLPERPVGIRIATPAEAAKTPAATIDVQALFRPDAPLDVIVPLRPIPRPGEPEGAYEDFTAATAIPMIAAHEGRPGHELQFTILKERGLSLARTLFAFNSVNVEGWGLYVESLVLPHQPPAVRLMGIRLRALREARAFLDPGLHAGTVTLDEAQHILGEELVFSPAIVRQELDRYTFGSPAQAVAYFVGLEHLRSLREEAEACLGPRFEALTFHDFLLGEGLLSPALLGRAVHERFLAGACVR